MRKTICALVAAFGFIASYSPADAKDRHSETMDNLHDVPSFVTGGHSVERYEHSSENYSDIPASVKAYLLHVLKNNFVYKHTEGTYPGRYLEKNKEGSCDEFALNALMHLKGKKDVRNLYLIIFGYHDCGIFCDDADSSVFSKKHAIVIYQSDDEMWHGLSNGNPLGIVGYDPDYVIDKFVAMSKGPFVDPKDVMYVSIGRIPAKMLTGSHQKDHWSELEKLLEKYNFR